MTTLLRLTNAVVCVASSADTKPVMLLPVQRSASFRRLRGTGTMPRPTTLAIAVTRSGLGAQYREMHYPATAASKDGST